MMSNKIRGANMATYSVRSASEEVIALTSETGRREVRGKAKGLYVHGAQGVPLVPRKDKVTYGRWKPTGEQRANVTAQGPTSARRLARERAPCKVKSR